MARRPATLTAAFVRTVSKPGVYGDGRGSRGLSLRVHRMKSGRLSRTWRQRLRVAGRLTTTGLGRFPEVSLAEARHKAIENARAIGQGVDPRGSGVPTFREAAEETIRLHAESWKAGSPLPREWHSTFRLYATPIRDKPVDRITSGDVLACLRPVWNVKPAAARKARNRLRAAFRWCVGQGYISTNPVDRAVAALPKVNGNGTTHHRALPHGEVPDALRRIRSANTQVSARLAVELIVLTAARSTCCCAPASLPAIRRSSSRRGPAARCPRNPLSGCSSWPVSPGRRCTVSERRFAVGWPKPAWTARRRKPCWLTSCAAPRART